MVISGSRFVDLDDAATRATLDEGLAGVLAQHRLDRFDRDVIMGPNRAVTGAIARYFYSLAQRPGFGDVVGLRYASRFAPEWERWAVWGHDAIYLDAREPMQPVTHNNASLRAAAARLGITLPPRLGER